MSQSIITNKVINLGFPKTGTTSIATFLKNLGYRSIHDPKFLYSSSLNETKFLSEPKWKQYDAFSGLFPMCWKMVVENSTDCHYILSTRNIKTWTKSASYHFRIPLHTPFREKVFGKTNLKWNNSYKVIYEEYNNEVRNYFKKNNLKLLQVDIESEGEASTRKIKEYLGKTDLTVSMPKKNVTKKKYG